MASEEYRRDQLVPLQDPRDDLVGFGVMGRHADVQHVLVVGDSHHGLFGGGNPLVGFALGESTERGGAGPHVLGQQPVQPNRLAHVGANPVRSYLVVLRGNCSGPEHQAE